MIALIAVGSEHRCESLRTGLSVGDLTKKNQIFFPRLLSPVSPHPRVAVNMASSDEPQPKKGEGGGGFFKAVSNFFEELDAFMDDAS